MNYSLNYENYCTNYQSLIDEFENTDPESRMMHKEDAEKDLLSEKVLVDYFERNIENERKKCELRRKDVNNLNFDGFGTDPEMVQEFKDLHETLKGNAAGIIYVQMGLTQFLFNCRDEKIMQYNKEIQKCNKKIETIQNFLYKFYIEIKF